MTRGSRNKNEKAGLISGRNPVHEILSRRAPEVEKLFVQAGISGAVIKEILSAASKAGIPVQYVPKRRLDEMTSWGVHQGVAAMAAEVGYLEIEDLLGKLGGSFDEIVRKRPLVLVLDRIQDPHNYGAILRSAAAAGAHGIVVPAARMAPLSSAAVKASAGTAGVVPIARVGKLPDAVTQLKEIGFWVVGLDGTGSQTIWKTDWKRPIAVVVGSEGSGMSEPVRKSCDEIARIPMYGRVESLNASVAVAITLFVAAHEREGPTE